MALIHKPGTTQPLMSVQITIDLVNDTAKDDAGNTVALKTGTGAMGVPIIRLPVGARVQGGCVFTEKALANSGNTAVVCQIKNNPQNTLLFNNADIRSAGARPIGFNGATFQGEDVSLILTSATALTSGVITVFLQYAVENRATEVL